MSIYTALENKYMAKLNKESAKKQTEMIRQLRLKEKQKYYGESNEKSIPISSEQKSVLNYFDELMVEETTKTKSIPILSEQKSVPNYFDELMDEETIDIKKISDEKDKDLVNKFYDEFCMYLSNKKFNDNLIEYNIDEITKNYNNIIQVYSCLKVFMKGISMGYSGASWGTEYGCQVTGNLLIITHNHLVYIPVAFLYKKSIQLPYSHEWTKPIWELGLINPQYHQNEIKLIREKFKFYQKINILTNLEKQHYFNFNYFLNLHLFQGHDKLMYEYVNTASNTATNTANYNINFLTLLDEPVKIGLGYDIPLLNKSNQFTNPFSMFCCENKTEVVNVRDKKMSLLEKFNNSEKLVKKQAQKLKNQREEIMILNKKLQEAKINESNLSSTKYYSENSEQLIKKQAQNLKNQIEEIMSLKNKLQEAKIDNDKLVKENNEYTTIIHDMCLENIKKEDDDLPKLISDNEINLITENNRLNLLLKDMTEYVERCDIRCLELESELQKLSKVSDWQELD